MREVERAIPPQFRAADNSWIGLSGRFWIVVYNTTMVKPDQIKSLLDLADPEWKNAEGSTVVVMIRPDDTHLTPNKSAEPGIVARQFRGSENLHTIRLPSGQVVHSSESSTSVYQEGTTVEPCFRPPIQYSSRRTASSLLMLARIDSFPQDLAWMLRRSAPHPT